jgi:hypothetical protein
MDIVKFATEVMGKHLFDWEKAILNRYEEFKSDMNYVEWVRPNKDKNQYLYEIWVTYNQYLNRP